MIRLPVSERGFAPALMVSAAIHAALLPIFLSYVAGSAPGQGQPFRESVIHAFLVPGHLAAGKAESLPVSKRREVKRDAPASVSPPAVPEKAVRTDQEVRMTLADVRPPVERSGAGPDPGALPALPAPLPGGAERSGSLGAVQPADRGEGGEGSAVKGKGAAVPIARREGLGEVPREGVSRQPKDADAVPRYGDNAHPVYPPLARLRGYQGVVILLVEVLGDGRAGRVGIRRSAGHEILDRAALEAVRAWRFEPGRREGRTVAMSVEVPVRFVLNGDFPR